VHHLNCHYCGYTESPPTKCKACGSTDIRTVGFGTEKIEEDLETLLPKARVARMDLDTTRSKHAYSKLLTAFGDGEIDILVGTQMVTKGLDFDNVALVGVLNADILLRFPDFRSMERAFQLMVQVSGRSGRKKERGQVVIQTYDPEHWVIRKVIDYDYEGLYRHELIERKKFLYPPFVRLIRLSLRHKDKHFLKVAALEFANDLRAKIGDRVIGPEAPFIERINNMYHQNILLKLERDGSPAKFKLAIQEVIDHFKADQKKRAIRIVPDVDPA
jgi:primosomal protein N' (replication factor Y)